MKYILIISAIFLIALGVAGLAYGGIDDSPGLQLLSVVLILCVLVLGVRTLRRSR